MRLHWWLVGLLVPFISTERAVGVVSLQATSATVAATGETADLCVVLNSDGAQVAGTQNDLAWDDSCATLASRNDCRVNPATGKSLSDSVASAGGFYRALVLSLSDVEPIPDGPLYCCTFGVRAAPGSCCAVSVLNTGASDPAGRVLVSVGNTARLCVADSRGNAPPTPTPTVNGDPPPSDGGGCQISPRSPSGHGSGPLAVAFLLALLARRRRRPNKLLHDLDPDSEPIPRRPIDDHRRGHQRNPTHRDRAPADRALRDLRSQRC